MKKLKSVFAILGVIILISLYVVTFVFAIIDDPRSFHLLGTALTATVVIPTMIWIIGIFVRLSSPTDRPEDNSENNKNNRSDNTEE